MNKKALVIFSTFFVIIMVTPVLAIGPLNVPDGKNKNILSKSDKTVTIWTQPTDNIFPAQLGEGVFKSWGTPEDAPKYTYMRLDASKVNIGNAVDGSLWTFPINDPVASFAVLASAETTWVYLTTAGYYNLLRGNAYPPTAAGFISGWFPEGVYFKAKYVGNP